MDEILRLVLAAALVISLAGIAAYVVVLAGVVASTLRGARRPDPLAGEVDRLLAGLSGDPQDPSVPAGWPGDR